MFMVGRRRRRVDRLRIRGVSFIDISLSENGRANIWLDNNFLTLDLTKTWDIASPALSGLPQPSGPPAVAMGALWHSWNSLWLYGGEFSDSPSTSPLPVSTWEYDIASSSWTEFSDPQTSAGNSSDGGSSAVQRAAEGAGLSVPELGLSWYFGGHVCANSLTSRLCVRLMADGVIA
jgi:hypothetical protein